MSTCLDRTPGSLKTFLVEKRDFFLKWFSTWKDHFLATEVKRLFNSLRSQVSAEFEVIVEGVAKAYSTLSLHKQVAKHFIEKWRSTLQALNLSIEYYNNEITNL